MPDTDNPAQPWAVLRIVNGYRQARLLLAAWELDVFTELAREPRAATVLAADLGLAAGPLRDSLHALTELGLLTRDHDGRYHAGADTARYLSRDAPDHLGGFLDFLDAELHPAWDGLVGSLRTGRPANVDARQASPYGGLYQAPSDRDSFLETMDFINSPLARQLARFDWSGRRTVADVGGARGNLAAILVGAHPQLRATVFDLPHLRPAFDKHISALGLTDSVEFRGGDFFTDPLPAADVVVLGHVLHNWPEPLRRELVHSAFSAVNPGGAVFVYDAMIDDETPRLANAMVSLDMLVWSAGGSGYSASEATTWLHEAGFTDVTRHPHGASSSVLIGHKPA